MQDTCHICRKIWSVYRNTFSHLQTDGKTIVYIHTYAKY